MAGATLLLFAQLKVPRRVLDLDDPVDAADAAAAAAAAAAAVPAPAAGGRDLVPGAEPVPA